MDIYEAVNNRRSIRAYKTNSVPKETVVKVVDAARMAPSWANGQCWRFILVESKVEKKLLGKASGQANIAKACEDAPYVVVFCASPKESGSKNGMDYYMFDCGLAMQSFVLAAHAEGLATCIIGWFDEKSVKGMLNIPDGYKVVAFTPLGCGSENPPRRSRKKYKDIVYDNTWGKSSGE